MWELVINSKADGLDRFVSSFEDIAGLLKKTKTHPRPYKNTVLGVWTNPAFA